MTGTESFEKPSFETIEPDAAALIESLRNIGYTMSTAVADIIDNSLTADASQISIRVDANPEQAAAAVIDDGKGLTADELLTAMKPDSRAPTEMRSKVVFGFFGPELASALLVGS